MISIQRFLTLALVATITLVLAAGQWRSFFDIRHEVEEVFDAQLAQYARLLLKSDVMDGFSSSGKPLVTDILEFPLRSAPSSVNKNSSTLKNGSSAEGDEATLLGHKYERKVAFQIWHNRQLAIRSINAPEDPWGEALRPGYHNSLRGGHLWRIFILHGTENDSWIAVGERDDIRDEISEEIISEGLKPLLIAIIVIWVLVTVVVRYGLAPLVSLARDLHLRRSENLSPIKLERTPRELDEVVLAINRLFQRLQNALHRERAFTSDAAHELRTPIAAMKIHLDNVRNASNLEEARNSMSELDKALQRSSRLIAQLLTLARLDPETSNIEMKKVNPAKILRESWHDLTLFNEEKQLTLKIIGNESTEINGANDLLHILFSNLLRNAIAHAPANSQITVQLTPNNSLSEGKESAKLQIGITDQGPGIASDMRERVLDRFYRTKDSKLRDNDGSGLGLTIAEQIAQLHNAELTLHDSPEPPGLRVTLLFR